MITVKTRPCPLCKKISEIAVDIEGYSKWQNGTLIQMAMPNLSRDDRELLISGTHPECWEKMFQTIEEIEEIEEQ